MTPITLLGPQRRRPTVRAAVEDLIGAGAAPVAAITAGWEEREAEDIELEEHLGRPVRNLELFQRVEDVFARDPELAEADAKRRDALRELRGLYRLRLRHTSPVVHALLRRSGEGRILEAERLSAFEALRALDDHQLEMVTAIDAEFDERWRPLARDPIRRHRRELAAILAETQLCCVAGGHVAILLERMRMLGVAELLAGKPLVAWSAGAMVLAEKIVLFHDSPPQGKGHAEVLGRGLEVCRGLVPLPHAASRLRLDDPIRVSALARRFAPTPCLTLDEGSRLDHAGGELRGAQAVRRLRPDGAVEEVSLP